MTRFQYLTVVAEADSGALAFQPGKHERANHPTTAIPLPPDSEH